MNTLDVPHLFLSEQLCVHHLDLDRNQSEGLKCQTPSASVVVLNTQTRKHKHYIKVAENTCTKYQSVNSTI